jgi:hypothetical protein
MAEATRKLADISDVNVDLNFLSNVISNNTTIPVLLTDEKGEMISYRNLDSLKVLDTAYVRHEYEIMKEQHEPIIISLFEGQKNYIYYKDSVLLTKLRYYPYFHLPSSPSFCWFPTWHSAARARPNRTGFGWAWPRKQLTSLVALVSLMAWVNT